MNNSKLNKLINYSDKYIAFVGDFLNIIASGNTMGEVEAQLKMKKVTDATITYIPPVNKTFTPLCQ